MKASDVKGFGTAPAEPTGTRTFLDRGEQRYTFTIAPIGITFDVDRLGRRSHELWGELAVRVNGSFPAAKTIEDGLLSIGDLNFSSVQARGTRAKILADRSRNGDLDWHGLLEEFAVKILAAERRGEPSVILADFPKASKDSAESWDFSGFPVLKRHPTVLFGKGASGKSYFAIWIAGQLAQLGVPVLYLDWELAGDEHRSRLDSLFQPAPRNVHYVHCRLPLRDSMERIARLIRDLKIGFAIFDSVGPASRAGGGRFQDGDLGQEYFGLVRAFGIGSLHVAHPPKRVDDEKTATIYGSAFFDYLARSVWFVQAADNAPAGQVLMGLYHHKYSVGAKLSPRAYRLLFEGQRTRIESTELKAIDELVANLPILDRILHKLQRGSMTVKELAADLDVPQPSIRKTLNRHASKFSRPDKNIVALAPEPQEMF